MTFLSLQTKFLDDATKLREQFKEVTDKTRKIVAMFLADNAELDPSKPVLYFTNNQTLETGDVVCGLVADGRNGVGLIYNVLKDWQEEFDYYGDEMNAVDFELWTAGDLDTLISVLAHRSFSWESLAGATLKAGS